MTDLNPAVNITVNVGPGTYESIPVKGIGALQPQGSPNSHIQKPSVGRIVHYWHTDEEVDDPWAAMILKVYEDNACELAIFWPTSYKKPVPFQDSACAFSETPKPGHWSWPARA